VLDNVEQRSETNIHTYIYINNILYNAYIYIDICCTFVGLDNELYEMRDIYVKIKNFNV